MEREEKHKKAAAARKATMDKKAADGGTANSAVAAALARVKAKNEDLRKKPEYRSGYRRAAKSKKLRGGMIGSVVGTAIGLVAGQFITLLVLSIIENTL